MGKNIMLEHDQWFYLPKANIFHTNYSSFSLCEIYLLLVGKSIK